MKRPVLITLLLFMAGCVVGWAISGRTFDLFLAAWPRRPQYWNDMEIASYVRPPFRFALARNMGVMFAAVPASLLLSGGKTYLIVRMTLHLTFGAIITAAIAAFYYGVNVDSLNPIARLPLAGALAMLAIALIQRWLRQHPRTPFPSLGQIP